MKHFTTVHDIKNPLALVDEALEAKLFPGSYCKSGIGKTMGLIFMNPSLRTRISTQKAAIMLGMDTMVMNIDKEGWALEFKDNVIMNGTSVEHIKDAAAVMGQYFDIMGVRCFPSLKNRREDYSEKILVKFMKYSGIPVVSMESATLHPLQSLADMMTIRENWKLKRKPKVVLTWAPHIKALPQAVANSFAEWSGKMEHDLVIAQPEGFELHADYTAKAKITCNQEEALENADFVYVKNWSSFEEYGKVFNGGQAWLLDEQKMHLTNNAKLMHCLPVRRNLELPDALIDGPDSLILQQANNRQYAAVAVLKRILDSNTVVRKPILNEEMI